MKKLLFIIAVTLLLGSISESGLQITPAGGGGTIPNTANLLIGGASNTAGNSSIVPSNVPLLNAANTFTGATNTFAPAAAIGQLIVKDGSSQGTANPPLLITNNAGTAKFGFGSIAMAAGTLPHIRGDGSNIVLNSGSGVMFLQRDNPGTSIEFQGPTLIGSTYALGWTSTLDPFGQATDTSIARTAAGVLTLTSDLKARHITVSGLLSTSAAAPTIASAGTIAPTTRIVFISGTAAIATITAPAPISTGGGQIILIPTGIFTTTTGGNIALASTAVVSKALLMVYDVTTAKWYPGY